MSKGSEDIAIKLQNVSKTYRIREKGANTIKSYIFGLLKPKGKYLQINALQDINFEVKKGEAIGIIGRNGSGKSTLVNIILGGIRPDPGGTIRTNGKIIKLALGIGFDQNLTARDNIFLNGALLGLSKQEIEEKLPQLMDFSGLHKFIDTPIKFYSKGMKSRLTFSIAMHAKADIFLLDEFFGGVGDEEFKKKSRLMFLDKIKEGKTLVIVSHGKNVIKKFCDKTIWIENGKIKKSGKTVEILKEYKSSFKKKKRDVE